MDIRNLSRFNRGRCVLCHERSANRLDLCQFCVAELQIGTARCDRCAHPLPAVSASAYPYCGQCLVRPPPLTATRAACAYDYPADALVGGLKFQSILSHGRVMGQLLARTVGSEPEFASQGAELIVPVPLSRRRHWQRGFNQSEEIARACARELKLPMSTRHLRRHRHGRPQSGLSADERRQNMRGAFHAHRVSGCKIALVDDVMTTGSTVYAAASALRQAGASAVVAWVFARAS